LSSPLTGQRLDSTGLYYYNARYYDPTIGRFISPDTIIRDPANPQCFNRYSYCLNNPLKYTDPSGHDPYWDLIHEGEVRDRGESMDVEKITSIIVNNPSAGFDPAQIIVEDNGGTISINVITIREIILESDIYRYTNNKGENEARSSAKYFFEPNRGSRGTWFVESSSKGPESFSFVASHYFACLGGELLWVSTPIVVLINPASGLSTGWQQAIGTLGAAGVGW